MIRSLLKRCQGSLLIEMDRLESRLAVQPTQLITRSAPFSNTDRGAEISNCIGSISKRWPSCSMLVYGSQVTGKADSFSDLDILIIETNRHAPTAHERGEVEGVSVDITHAGACTFRRILSAKHKHNNNWLLQAFRDCHIYCDGSREISMLRRVADRMLIDGPPRLDVTSARKLESELAYRLRACRTPCQRAYVSPELAVLARMRCDQLISCAIYALFCVNRQWTTSFRRLLERCRDEEPHIRNLWSHYALTPDIREAIQIAEGIASDALEKLSTITSKRSGITLSQRGSAHDVLSANTHSL